MTREEILIAIQSRLSNQYPPNTAAALMSSIQGQLDEWDALPPYPSESDFQSMLSSQIYPLLALSKAVRGKLTFSEAGYTTIP